MNLTLAEYITRVEDGSLSPDDVIYYYLTQAWEDPCNAWVRLHNDYALKNKDAFSSKRFHAAPIAVKDNFMTQWYETTCASKILQWYKAPYTATCIGKLEEAGWLMIGKTNMDEFAMWASNEQSAFGSAKHHLDHARVPWWSSWGSAIAVAADQCIASLGTDTWWSVRLPASLCGIVGMKPTYGRISRYGVQAMAASLNQVWVLTKTVEDSVLLLDAISGHDPNDAVTIDRGDEQQAWFDQLQRTDLQWVRLALPKQFFGEWLEGNVKEVCKQSIGLLQEAWAIVEEVDLPILQYVVPTYYIIVPAEVSTDMARFDGIRFGHQDDTMNYDSIFDYYEAIRKEWFGDEVKRRIIIWSYVLSAWFYDAYYHRAQQVRQKMKETMKKVFQDYDAVIWPTSPSVAWKRWDKVDDPVQMYLMDVYTAVANLLWLPAISVPVWTVNEEGVDLPVGFHIMSASWKEDSMFGIASVLEKKVANL